MRVCIPRACALLAAAAISALPIAKLSAENAADIARESQGDKVEPGAYPTSGISTEGMDIRLDPTARADQAFIQRAMTTTIFTIAVARMAERERSLPANVRHAARDLIDDGNAREGRLRSLAVAQGFVVPYDLAGYERRRLDRLSSCHGLDFLDAWVSLEITTQDGAISLFTGESRHSSDQRLGALASHELPTLEADRRQLGSLPFGDDQDDWWRYWQRDETSDMAPGTPGHMLTQ